MTCRKVLPRGRRPRNIPAPAFSGIPDITPSRLLQSPFFSLFAYSISQSNLHVSAIYNARSPCAGPPVFRVGAGVPYPGSSPGTGGPRTTARGLIALQPRPRPATAGLIALCMEYAALSGVHARELNKIINLFKSRKRKTLYSQCFPGFAYYASRKFTLSRAFRPLLLCIQ